jgi:hypothetical protein
LGHGLPFADHFGLSAIPSGAAITLPCEGWSRTQYERCLGHYGGLRQRVIDLTQARDDYGVIEFPKRRIPSPRERHGPAVIWIPG